MEPFSIFSISIYTISPVFHLHGVAFSHFANYNVGVCCVLRSFLSFRYPLEIGDMVLGAMWNLLL